MSEINFIQKIGTIVYSISTKPLFAVFALADELVHKMLRIVSSLLTILLMIPITGMIWMITFLSSVGTRLRSFVLDTFFYICGEVVCTFCTMFIVVICGVLFWTLNTYARIYKSLIGRLQDKNI